MALNDNVADSSDNAALVTSTIVIYYNAASLKTLEIRGVSSISSYLQPKMLLNRSEMCSDLH